MLNRTFCIRPILRNYGAHNRFLNTSTVAKNPSMLNSTSNSSNASTPLSYSSTSTSTDSDSNLRPLKSNSTIKKWSRHIISTNPQKILNNEDKNLNNDLTDKPKRRKRRTLKPLKAPITLTENAKSHLRALSNGPNPKLIRISVRNRGCSGLTYHLEYVDKPDKFDEIVESGDIKVVIDSKALFSIIGSEMDWVDNKLSSKFVFKNPNSKGTCGCGESFMV